MLYFRNIIISFCLISAVLPCKAQKKENTKQPNVLIIFPDQLRRYAAGFWSQEPYKSLAHGKADPVLTPSIDKLAKNGIVFTHAISNYPLCSPYRGMLLSGKYPEQNGIWNNCKVGRPHSLKDDIPTIPSLFLKAGYNTAYIGKCHWLRNDPVFDKNGNYKGTTKAPGGHHVNTYDTYIPSTKRHGIEYFYQALKDEHFNPHIYSNDPNTIEGKKDGELHLPKIFSPKNEAKIIIDYLRNKGKHRDTSKPFCMIWSMNPPHNPWDDKNTDMEVLRENYDTDKFPTVNDLLVVRKNVDKKVAHYARHYYANVTSSDYYIGLVLNELKKSGALDNTIVIFSSDHGEMLGSHGKTGKNAVELESLAIPFIVHWPKGLQPGTEDLILSVPDILPTTLGLAGIEKHIPKSIEGVNYAPILQGIPNAIEKPKAALIMLGNSRGVETERYTFCIQENKKQWDQKKDTSIKSVFFYDNQLDPYQLHKIDANSQPKVKKELLLTLAQLLEKTNDPWYQKKKHSYLIPYRVN
ncbi:sulfatase family protein [Wenyingzhuangia sp. IMCC45574]